MVLGGLTSRTRFQSVPMLSRTWLDKRHNKSSYDTDIKENDNNNNDDDCFSAVYIYLFQHFFDYDYHYDYISHIIM